jgi:hypothetical protein
MPAEGGAAPYTIAASFHRGAGQRERLAPGERVSPGDSLSLVLEASAGLYVYVLNEDERGEAYLLFPVPGLSPSNPLPAGARAVLPGSLGERPFYWRVTSAGEEEHFLIVASPRRLASFEKEIATLEPASSERPVSYARFDTQGALLDELRGVGGLADGDHAGATQIDGRAASRRLFEIAEPLAAGTERVAGVWIRRIDLANPTSAAREP